MAKSFNREHSLIDLEAFIDHSYKHTVDMAKFQRQQTLMDLLNQTGLTSTPIQNKIKFGDLTTENKRKATSPINLTTSDDGCMDMSTKEYLDNMTSCITQQITDSTTKLEDLIKHQGSDIDQLRSENKALKAKHLINEGRLTRVEKVVVDLKEELLKVQQHSMKENLIFQNIPEKQQENVNTILREYMSMELKISDELLGKIGVIRAHRMGIKGKFPRSIVAKINDAGRNIILRHTKNLKGKNTSVYTQLPRELAERKKQLVPLFKQARAANKTTRWLGDKLMVGNQVHDAKPDHLGNIKPGSSGIACQMEIVRAPQTQHEGSRFQASRVEIDDPSDVTPALQAVYADPQVAGATHNIYAYRIRSGEKLHEHFEDDGEFGAGRRLMDLLRENDAENILVCVTRWYGGRHIGPARFQMVIDNAKSVLQY